MSVTISCRGMLKELPSHFYKYGVGAYIDEVLENPKFGFLSSERLEKWFVG